MFEKYFNIRYIFGKENVWEAIDNTITNGGKGYIVVADGVVVSNVQKDADFRKTVDGSLFAICDSSWVPLYIKRIYGEGKEQYCGAMILKDMVVRRKHRMMFLGTDNTILEGLKGELVKMNPDVGNMMFHALPFRNVEDFDYEGIARMIEKDGAEIIFVALGAPKQCRFMQRLQPFLSKGVMIGVGAAFKFYSGTAEKRAPEWMVKSHLEFAYRIMQDPKKQLKRCYWITRTLPGMLCREWRKKRRN